MGPPSPGFGGALAHPLGKRTGKNSFNFWALHMEFILCGEEGGKGVNLCFVGNLYRAGGERREGEKKLVGCSGLGVFSSAALSIERSAPLRRGEKKLV